MPDIKPNGAGPRYFLGISAGTWVALAAVAAIATYSDLRSDMRNLNANDAKQDAVIKEFRDKFDGMQQTLIETKTLVQILLQKANAKP